MKCTTREQIDTAARGGRSQRTTVDQKLEGKRLSIIKKEGRKKAKKATKREGRK